MTEREVISDWDMDKAQELGDNSIKFMDKITDANAVLIYGIISTCISVLAVSLYVPLRSKQVMQGMKWGMFQHFGIWTPLTMIWIGMSVWDSDMMRQIYKWLVEFSVLAPFGGYWLALTYLFDTASEYKFWDSWKLWITVPIWITYTCVSMVVQVGLVPKVLNWIETAPIVEGDGLTRKERREQRNAAKDAEEDDVAEEGDPASDF